MNFTFTLQLVFGPKLLSLGGCRSTRFFHISDRGQVYIALAPRFDLLLCFLFAGGLPSSVEGYWSFASPEGIEHLFWLLGDLVHEEPPHEEIPF